MRAILTTAFAASCVHALFGIACRKPQERTLYSRKLRCLSTKRWLPSRAGVADKCRNAHARIGGICRARFTAPKYLGSMVRNWMQPQDCPAIMKPHESALQVRGLTKRFDRLAVDALDLTVRSGEFYALVGPNGAGKTTTLRMVAGLLRPDAGTVAVFGIDALADPVAAKQMMAWVSDEPMIYDKLTPLEYLEFVAGLWGIDPATSEPAAHRSAGLARTGAASARALRGIFQGHAPEGRAGRRAGARPPPDHPGRAADRARRGVRAPRQGIARRSRPRRLHRDHDHAYSRSRRTHGRPDRRHRRGTAGRGRHAGRTAPAERRITTPASKICSSRWSMSRPPRHEFGRRAHLVCPARDPAGMARMARDDDGRPAQANRAPSSA